MSENKKTAEMNYLKFRDITLRFLDKIALFGYDTAIISNSSLDCRTKSNLRKSTSRRVKNFEAIAH